jgi:hypothetical protein
VGTIPKSNEKNLRKKQTQSPSSKYTRSFTLLFKSLRGKNKQLTALKSNSNTGWFNFQTYIWVYIRNFVSQMQIVLAVLADLLFLDIHELINRNLIY